MKQKLKRFFFEPKTTEDAINYIFYTALIAIGLFIVKAIINVGILTALYNIISFIFVTGIAFIVAISTCVLLVLLVQILINTVINSFKFVKKHLTK